MGQFCPAESLHVIHAMRLLGRCPPPPPPPPDAALSDLCCTWWEEEARRLLGDRRSEFTEELEPERAAATSGRRTDHKPRKNPETSVI